MKNLTKQEITDLVISTSNEVFEVYYNDTPTSNKNINTENLITEVMIQMQRNCENIIIEILDKILNNEG